MSNQREFDFIVIGAGIAGQSAVRSIRARGMSVLLLSQYDPMMGSNAAVGVIRVAWFKSPKQRLRVRRTLDIYRENKWLIAKEADVTSWQRPGIMKREKDHFLVDVPLTLGEPTLETLVERIEYPTVIHRAGSAFARTGIIVAAGVNTPSFGGPNGKRSYGATYVEPSQPGKAGLAIHRVRPYNCIHAGYGVTTRIGSSSCLSIADALPRLNKAVANCPQRGISVPEGAFVVQGARLHSEYDLSKDYEPLRIGNITYLSGFGKMGFSLAPAIAEEVVNSYLK